MPPIVWMVMIFSLSTDSFSATHTASILEPLLHALFPGLSATAVALAHALVRKGAHVTIYGILAWLWFRALRRESALAAPTAAALAFAVSVAWAAVDEGHQARVPSRTASAWDVAIDGAGATVALAALRAVGAYAGETRV